MQKKTADWHRADVVAALKKNGWSVRALSMAHGLSPNTLKTALGMPYLKGEKIIADAIGITPQEIWPNRYETRNFQPLICKVANV